MFVAETNLMLKFLRKLSCCCENTHVCCRKQAALAQLGICVEDT